jgi:O-acetyl-ADP-ribose deacetylase (regulator of RNase III)
MALVGQILIANKTKLSLFKGDITERNVDAIVNATNSYLSHGGGVAEAIVKKGGRIIQD